MSDTPDWFWEAVDTQPESGEVEVDDCDINYLKWSEASDQGLLFIPVSYTHLRAHET